MNPNKDSHASISSSKDDGAGASTARAANNQPRAISIAEARSIAFEASVQAQLAQLAYADEEARRLYDYKTEE